MKNFVPRILILFLILGNTFAFGQNPGPENLREIIRSAYAIRHTSADSAEILSRLAIRESQNTGNPGLAAEAFLIRGMNHTDQAEYDSALTILNRGLEKALISENLQLIARYYREMGYTLSMLGEFPKSMDLLLKSRQIYKNENDVNGQALVYITLAELFRKLEKPNESEYYLQLARRISDNDSMPLDFRVYLLHRIAAVKSEHSMEDSALIYSERALELNDKLKNPHYQATSLNEIGFILEKKGKLNMALPLYSEAAGIWNKTGFKRYEANARTNHARALFKTGNREAALQEIKRVIPLAKSANWPELLLSSYNLMVQNYADRGDYKKALEYHLLESETFNQLHENRWKSEVEEMQARFQNEQTQRLLAEKENQLAMLTAGAEKSKREFNQLLFMFLAAGMFLLFSMAAALIVRRKNSNLQRKSAELEKLNNELGSLIRQKEVLFREVHHRVKNNLAVLSGLLRLQVHYIDNDDARHILINSQNRIHSIAMVHEKLYAIEGVDRVDFKDFTRGLLEHLDNTYAVQKGTILYHIDSDDIPLDINLTVPLALILNELVTNSYKHAFKKNEAGRIGIRLKKTIDRKVVLMYSDTGPGLPQDPTKNESGALGLNLVQILTEQLGGELQYNRQPEPEFRIEFEIPEVSQN